MGVSGSKVLRLHLIAVAGATIILTAIDMIISMRLLQDVVLGDIPYITFRDSLLLYTTS